MKLLIVTRTLLVLAGSISFVFAQAKSAVQFFDTTGTKETAKFGWAGDETNGKFFIQTPGAGEAFTIQNGVINGKFTGDGSGLTGLTKPADMSSALGTKADTVTTYTKQRVDALIGSMGSAVKSVSPGTGLIGGNTTGNILLQANFTTSGGNSGINGTDSTVARGDHKHDLNTMSGLLDTSKVKNGQYMINSAGTANQVWTSNGSGAGKWAAGSSAPVTSVSGVTGGGITVTPTTGAVTVQVDNTIAKKTDIPAFGGTGSVTTAARSDHVHPNYSKSAYSRITAGDEKIIGNAESVSQITMTVPAKGTVLVWCNASVMLSSAGYNGKYGAISFCISTSQNTIDDAAHLAQHWAIGSPAGIPQVVSAIRSFSVVEGQTYTFYINFKGEMGTNFTPPAIRGNVLLMAEFIKED